MESREEKESQGKILWKIFLSTLYLSAFTFGGGYVIVTLMKKKFVDEYHWISIGKQPPIGLTPYLL